uniref:DUF1697 domain-containing protein n=1 Tax=Burkholderia arboris TaxID=488730 RepID=UPI003BEF144D
MRPVISESTGDAHEPGTAPFSRAPTPVSGCVEAVAVCQATTSMVFLDRMGLLPPEFRISMRYICLLRGINVSGHRKVTMKELLELCTEMKFRNAINYLQSGNLVLDSTLKPVELESTIEHEIAGRFGYVDVSVMALTEADLSRMIDGIPKSWRDYDSSKVHFSFLKTAGAEGVGATSRDYLPDEYVVGKRVVYVHCPNGYGRTKLNNSFVERLTGTQATTRNWNTTHHLRELVAA